MYNPQLETFLRVADAGSFNKAAEELFITPPAVIKQITSLESGLGFPLFVRSHRGLALTPEGKSLYRDAQYVIQYCRDAIIRAKRRPGGRQGHPHRHVPHDAGAVPHGPLAPYPRILPGRQIQAGALREHAGKRPGNSAESGGAHRHRGGTL